MLTPGIRRVLDRLDDVPVLVVDGAWTPIERGRRMPPRSRASADAGSGSTDPVSPEPGCVPTRGWMALVEDPTDQMRARRA